LNDLSTVLLAVSNTYLGEFLAQLQQEGYSIFIVKGKVSPAKGSFEQKKPLVFQLSPVR
jgi:hypothetical protein